MSMIGQCPACGGMVFLGVREDAGDGSDEGDSVGHPTPPTSAVAQTYQDGYADGYLDAALDVGADSGMAEDAVIAAKARVSWERVCRFRQREQAGKAEQSETE